MIYTKHKTKHIYRRKLKKEKKRWRFTRVIDEKVFIWKLYDFKVSLKIIVKRWGESEMLFLSITRGEDIEGVEKWEH